ncbi:MAG TPA: DPP IV N-terminal domain-containing protein [Gemmatimonadaceae bacterium]|nr:DPP IV N-terminal domain-containing protein [Gemmatimonadaceae bacterium]
MSPVIPMFSRARARRTVARRLSPLASLFLAGIVIGAYPGGALAQSDQRPAVQPRPSYYEPGISPDGAEIAFVSGGDIWGVPTAGGTAHLLVSDEATEARPLFSPDGKRLAFTSTRTGNGDVYVLDFASGALRRLTFGDGADELDAWSPDGRWIYFTNSSHDISGMNDILRVSVDGGTPMPVSADRYTNEFWAAPSPDGRELAFTAPGIVSSQWWRKGHSHLDESEIWLLTDPAHHTYKKVSTTPAKYSWPMWSGDGHTLYFMSDRSGSQNLWAQPLSGEPRQLTHLSGGRVLWPTIDRAGHTIAFERGLAIWTAGVASGRAHEVPITLRGVADGTAVDHLHLTSRFRDLALSADGEKVAFVAHGELFAASTSDSDATTVRITHTAANESQVAWAPDSRRIVYVSDRDGATHLYLYDFVTRTETRLTNDTANDVSPSWSPDGRSIAFERGGRELRVLDVASHNERRLATGEFGRAPFVSSGALAWSPDGRWIAYAAPSDGQFDNIYVVPASGGESHAVSFLPNGSAGNITWSRDGTYLLFTTGQRTETTQLARLDLIPRAPRFREDQFRDLFHEETPRPATPTPLPPARDSSQHDSLGAAGVAHRRGRSARAAEPAKPVRIVFDGIRQRISFLPVGVDVNAVSLSPDGKTALLTARVAGQQNLYLYSLDDLAQEPPVARQLTTTAGRKSDAYFSPDGKKVFYLEGGRVRVMTIASHRARPLSVAADMDVDFNQEKSEVFAQAWRYLDDNFFDPKFNGVDWNAMRAKYAPYIAGARTPDEMRRVIVLMIGELNSSHSGINGGRRSSPETGRLGLRFDAAEYERAGRLRITRVLPLSPAALSGGIAAGDELLAVNGTRIGAHTNLDELLDHTIDKRVRLTIADSTGGHPHEVAVRPVSTNAEKQLIYRAWVEQKRAYVARVSNGKLGYVHLPDMSAQTLQDFYYDLDVQNREREGVVIDIRNNNGGFVNAYALDVLSRRPYLMMTRRGRTPVPMRTALGERSLEHPTILVTNRRSLSDAEDFTQGYRALGLGKVVGQPTAGWIIYTSNVSLIDGSSVRLPSTRVTTLDGSPMELHPRPVDIAVQRPIGESYTGHDAQLDAAVKELLREIAQRPQQTVGTKQH